ncbi:MAG: vitamin B12-dependent ribonucleotide reductase [Chloroflexota bacterium]
MELSANALTVLERRYLKKVDGKVVETPADMFERVARNIAEVDGTHYGKDQATVDALTAEFKQSMMSLEFIPNSPTLMNAGRELQQLAACFVLPVEDSMVEIFDAIKYAALIHQSGGGTGFSFSRLRPKNDVVRSTGGVASGPISFMKVFNAATEAVKQGGTRRGANMGILRVDHPDIIDFITCKTDNAEITNFNISVGLTDEFMAALAAGGDYPLRNPRNQEIVRMQSAREVFDLIVEQAWKNGEPGIIFLDRLNKANPTPEVGAIESTNPCGEQPLLPYEACNLGSINLELMVRVRDGVAEVDYDRLGRLVRLAVHFLDNVIDAGKYPLPQIDAMVKANRKIGLGVMGFADMLIRMGIAYDSPEAVELATAVMSFIQRTAREASQELAVERGAFPNFSRSIYKDGPALRNATVTTIAPTGTISMIAGCSSGIEPLFALCYVKNVMDNDKLLEINPLFERIAKERGFYSRDLMERVAEHGSISDLKEIPEDVRRVFVTAHDITPEWHIRIQAAFQAQVDNAVSKTVNFRNSATREDVATVFRLADELGCKGVTIYRDGSRESQVLTVPGKTEPASPEVERQVAAAAPEAALAPAGGELAIRHKPRPRPDETHGMTRKFKIGGCGSFFVTVNGDENGICEIFTNTGEEGCAALSEAVGRLVSIALRSGIEPDVIIDQIKGIKCIGCIVDPETRVLSCPDAIGKAIEKFVNGHNKFDLGVVKGPRTVLMCPEPGCGGFMVHEGGCYTCTTCGYSKCG